MTNQNTNDERNKTKTDEAWTKLQSKLTNEPMSPIWLDWDQRAESTVSTDAINHTFDDSADTIKHETAFEQQAVVVTPAKRVRRGMNRRRKWAAAAAGVAVFAAILSTPVGNTAMASILNQFRMQNVTVVHESDLENLFNQITENGDIKESANKFGVFSNSSGLISGDLPIDKISKTLGYSPISGIVSESKNTVSVNPSQEITLNLHVDEVNKIMKKLGAEQLLPESVDGKPITLHIPEVVNYNLSPNDKQWASLTQMNAPVLTVDPSIKVEEAVEAVINFPLLPDYLKLSLKQSRILSGEIPMPLVAGEDTEQMTIGSTIVLLNHYDTSQGAIYDATWVQNGQLLQFQGGSIYQGKEKFVAKLQELIES